jgi:hypothetical protein
MRATEYITELGSMTDDKIKERILQLPRTVRYAVVSQKRYAQVHRSFVQLKRLTVGSRGLSQITVEENAVVPDWAIAWLDYNRILIAVSKWEDER